MTPDTVAQDVPPKTRVQWTIQDEAIARIFAAAGIRQIQPGEMVSILALEHLPPVPRAKHKDGKNAA